jgi:hypothetical protein
VDSCKIHVPNVEASWAALYSLHWEALPDYLDGTNRKRGEPKAKKPKGPQGPTLDRLQDAPMTLKATVDLLCMTRRVLCTSDQSDANKYFFTITAEFMVR